ncbi:hypothetical protein AVEN_195666-1 [Araneus ventricosus]|uniref:CUB domain-containing protein n=1 Tax=Araneus ventricosus TaxID=182803 RepID=A0A4Y2B8K1_ARAVE|nr:hypothetical protein AVEN_195666-1 [Araneus ventricosus]
MYIVNKGVTYEVFPLDKYVGTNEAVISVGTYKNSSFVLRGFEPSTYELTNNTNFSIIIDIHDNDGIVVHISYLNVVAGCDSGEHIRISSQNKTVTFCQRILNPNAEPGSAYFHGKIVKISYITPSKITSFLQMTITGFTQGPCSSDDLFLCNSGICIWKGLVCDSQNNCGDGSDEHSPQSNSRCQTHSFDDMTNFIPLFIALPLLLLSVTLVLYCCIRRQSDESPYDAGEVVYVYEGDDSGTEEVQLSDRTDARKDKDRSTSVHNSEEMYHMKSRYSSDESASDATKDTKNS